jgi:hypothetical protein
MLALGGCYTSETFLLDGSKAVRILATGKQVFSEPAKADETLEIIPVADGWYEIRDEEDQPARVIFIPIAGQKDRYLMATGDADHTKHAFTYGVAVREGGKVGLAFASCSDPGQKAIARRNGAEIEQYACAFTNRAGLTKALTEVARLPHPISELMTLPALP